MKLSDEANSFSCENPSAEPMPIAVVKLGGHESEDPLFLLQFAHALKCQPLKCVVVHGGGKEISALEESVLGRQPKFENGLRVTDDLTMKIVEMVLCGSVNKRIVRALNSEGVRALGLAGSDAGLLLAKPLAHLGRAGKVTSVDIDVILHLLEQNLVPVIAPVCADDTFLPLNVNADEVAVAVAKALGAQLLSFVTNVPGVLLQGHLQEELTRAQVLSGIELGEISGGMIPKVSAALGALDAGLGHVRICDVQGLANGKGTSFVHVLKEF